MFMVLNCEWRVQLQQTNTVPVITTSMHGHSPNTFYSMRMLTHAMLAMAVWVMPCRLYLQLQALVV